jgi:hypothetical protein
MASSPQMAKLIACMVVLPATASWRHRPWAWSEDHQCPLVDVGVPFGSHTAPPFGAVMPHA